MPDPYGKIATLQPLKSKSILGEFRFFSAASQP
jgi:hypothetical protein